MRPRFPLLALALFALPLALPTTALAQSVGTFASSLNAIRGLAHDGAGNLYAILRSPAHQIVRFTLPGNTPTVVTSSGLADPIEGVFGDDGNLYVTDYTGGAVKKVTPGGTVTTFAAAASPAPITRDAAGNLYVGEYFSERILKVTPAGVVSVYVASVGAGTRLTMLSMEADGTLYAGMLTGEIYKIGAGGSPITTFCTGLGSVVGFTKGPDGDWYTATYDLHTIRRIPPAGGSSSVYAGSTAGYLDGPLSTAKFNYPSYVLYVPPTMYIADWNNDRIRTIDYATPATTSTWGRVKAMYR